MTLQQSSRGHHAATSRSSRLEIAILVCGFAIAAITGVAAYRISGPYGERANEDPRVRRFVDPKTGRLRLLVYDANGNGRFDTWSYMDGGRALRMEIDDDEDGRMDRWVHFRADGTVEKIGLSTAHDGQPDTWTYPEAKPAGTQGNQQ
jgi:hypothetical protein